MSKITVKSKSDRGFRRAGIQFTRDGVELDTSKLKAEELDAIVKEPNLVVVGEVETKEARKAREAAEKAAAEEKAKADKAAAEEKAKADKADASKAKGAK